MILVTGATGNAGLQVVRALLERGRAVRAFVRDVDTAHDRFGDAVEPAQGDFADGGSVRAALDGVEALLLSGPDDPRRIGWETSAIDAAAAMGVRRIVRLSAVGAAPGARAAFWDWHGRIDDHLLRSGVPAVVLRSGPYMSNVLAGAGPVAHEGRLYAPAGQAKMAMIDPRDVGAAAAAALTTTAPDGRAYVLTGPEAITYARMAAELSAATGRSVEYVDVPDEDARQGMVQAGLPEVVAEGIVEVYARLREGAAEEVTPAVASLTGRPARAFAAFARDHAPHFATAAVGAAR